MKVLVCGGAGYIGSVTVECLRKEGHDVFVFDNLERGHKQAICEDVFFLKGDLRNSTDICSAMTKVMPEAVIHFAAYIEVGESMATPISFFENNVVGSLNVARAMVLAQEKGVKEGIPDICRKLVFSSTCATYGTPPGFEQTSSVEPGGVKNADLKYMTEDLEQKPDSVYGESKLICEQMFKWIQKIHGIEFVFLRYFNACGASPLKGECHHPETHLIPLVLQVAAGKREKIFIFGDCTMLVADPTKAKDVLGWKPKYPSLEDIISSAWKWHSTHPKGYEG